MRDFSGRKFTDVFQRHREPGVAFLLFGREVWSVLTISMPFRWEGGRESVERERQGGREEFGFSLLLLTRFWCYRLLLLSSSVRFFDLGLVVSSSSCHFDFRFEASSSSSSAEAL